MWTDGGAIFRALDKAYWGSDGMLTLVHGDCPNGADAHAEAWYEWAIEEGYSVFREKYPADWKAYGKAAGYRRNAEMVKLGADLCLVFILDGSPGSSHTKKLAEKAGIETITDARSSMNLPVKRVEEELTLRNVRMIFKNFKGEERLPFNPAGRRNFSVELTQTQAMMLKEDGWNPKIIKRTADDPEPTWHLKVNVEYSKGTPPRIFFITKSTNSRNPIDEDLVQLVDRARFDKVDVTLSPYNYNVNGSQGVSAYLRTLYGVLHEDPLDREYSQYTVDGQPAQLAVENSRSGPLEIEAYDEFEGAIEIEEDSGWTDEDDEADDKK